LGTPLIVIIPLKTIKKEGDGKEQVFYSYTWKKKDIITD
jgi:hypothetical protein